MTNPKDKIGSYKVDLSLLPPVSLVHGAYALMDGAMKYGRFNWRSQPVQAHVYVAACMRHLLAWYDGEEAAQDSGVHHLGHALACCAILLDAEHNRALIDDRPKTAGEPVSELLAAISLILQRIGEPKMGLCGHDCGDCRDARECNSARRPTEPNCPGECRYCEHVGCKFGDDD